MAHDHIDPSPLTLMGGDRGFARRVGRPVRRFMRLEAAGGIVLLLATVVALIWANSPWDHTYHEILETHISIEIGDLLIDEPIEAWVNDALMAVFFFVVGLEIKRELVVGELRDPRAAALPALAALGGMVVPALIFLAFAAGGPGQHGWGIPMATDIAFALGVVSLLGPRVPSAMKVFLLTLAIVDDIGAIVVIAIFYSSGLSYGWMLAAVVSLVVVMMMRVARIWYIPAYVVVGMFVWLAVFESGVHATIAGVVLGIMTPARPLQPEGVTDHELVGRAISGEVTAPVMRRASFEIREQISVADRLQDVLHPFSSFLIVPVFALANAGIALSVDTITEAATSEITLGVIFGLVFGKLIGVSLFTYIGVRSGLSRLPRGATWNHVIGLAGVAGIGFTVSLFITGLAYDEPLFNDEARLGVLTASVIAAIVGSVLLSRARSVVEVEIEEPATVAAG
jgi:NhaA family Na+:H+ antiporter